MMTESFASAGREGNISLRARSVNSDTRCCCLLSATQGDRTHQQCVSKLTLRALKEIFLSLPVEAKDSVSIKKALQGDGDWTTTKEILGWMVDTNEGTLRISPKRKAELGTLLDIPPSQLRISTKKLERLIGKLRSMHLAVPGVVGHF